MTLHITKDIIDAFVAYENSVIDHDITGKPITLKEVYPNLSIVDFAAGYQAAPQQQQEQVVAPPTHQQLAQGAFIPQVTGFGSVPLQPVAWVHKYMYYPDSPENAPGHEVTTFHQNRNSPTLSEDTPLYTAAYVTLTNAEICTAIDEAGLNNHVRDDTFDLRIGRAVEQYMRRFFDTKAKVDEET